MGSLVGRIVAAVLLLWGLGGSSFDRLRMSGMVGWFGRQDFPPEADWAALRCQHTAGWVRNALAPTFSCTQCAKGAPARGLGQSRWSSWSILVNGRKRRAEPCHCDRLRFWRLTGLAVEVKSCLLGFGMVTAVLPWLHLGYMFRDGGVKGRMSVTPAQAARAAQYGSAASAPGCGPGILPGDLR